MATTTPPKNKFVSGLFLEQAAPLVKYLASRFTGRDEAQEIAQEAWLRIYRLDHPEQLDNPKAFLFQTASNLAIDKLRRSKVEQRLLSEQDRSGSTTSIEDSVESAQKLKLITAALHELPAKCRQAFFMHRVKGLSYPDIAAQLEVSTSMVEKYIIQTLKHLRSKLVE